MFSGENISAPLIHKPASIDIHRLTRDKDAASKARIRIRFGTLDDVANLILFLEALSNT